MTPESNQPTNSRQAGLLVTLASVLVCAMLGLQTITGCDGSGSTTYTPDRNTAGHRYATERFKQEGLSSSDAQTAADAVLRFNEAQKNRKR